MVLFVLEMLQHTRMGKFTPYERCCLLFFSFFSNPTCVRCYVSEMRYEQAPPSHPLQCCHQIRGNRLTQRIESAIAEWGHMFIHSSRVIDALAYLTVT